MQTLVMDSNEVEDPNGLGFPAGFGGGWPHVHSLLDKFLTTNDPWTREVSRAWRKCQSMLVTIIAVKYREEERKIEDCVVQRCVKDDCQTCTPVVLKGPPPKPRWPARHGHTQAHVDEELARNTTPAATLLRAADASNYVRDVGLDFHDDHRFTDSFSLQSNRAPYWGTIDDMFGPGCLATTDTPTATDESSEDEYADADTDDSGPDWPGNGLGGVPVPPDNTVEDGPLTSTQEVGDGLALAAAHLELLAGPASRDDVAETESSSERGSAGSLLVRVVDETQDLSDELPPLLDVNGVDALPEVLDSPDVQVVPPPPPAFLLGIGPRPVSAIFSSCPLC